MATFLDVGLFGYFGAIFPVLLVFLLVFATLVKTKYFGDNKGIYALIALSIAMIMLFSPNVVAAINVMAPWFVFVFIFSIMLLVGLMAVGVNPDAVTKYMSGEWGTVHWFILAISLVIAIGSLSAVFGESLLPYTQEGAAAEGGSGTSLEDGGITGQTTGTPDFNTNVGRVLFHPKVLGFMLIMLIGSFTIRLMAGQAT